MCWRNSSRLAQRDKEENSRWRHGGRRGPIRLTREQILGRAHRDRFRSLFQYSAEEVTVAWAGGGVKGEKQSDLEPFPKQFGGMCEAGVRR